MKKEITLKGKNTTIHFLVALGLSLTITSCNDTNRLEDSKTNAEEQNEEKLNNSNETDAKFLVAAAGINLEEIQLGQLAQKNSSNSDVIALGKMMETDHTQGLNDLKDLAERKQISIPVSITKDGEDAYSKLNNKTGDNFDSEYCDMMVKGHEKAIDKFEKASKDAKDEEIRTWAANTLPTLKMHLEHSKACRDKCRKKM